MFTKKASSTENGTSFVDPREDGSIGTLEVRSRQRLDDAGRDNIAQMRALRLNGLDEKCDGAIHPDYLPELLRVSEERSDHGDDVKAMIEIVHQAVRGEQVDTHDAEQVIHRVRKYEGKRLKRLKKNLRSWTGFRGWLWNGTAHRVDYLYIKRHLGGPDKDQMIDDWRYEILRIERNKTAALQLAEYLDTLNGQR